MSSSRRWASASGSSPEQVGGVVGRHRLQHVGGALVLQAAEQLDLLVLGHLLEHVGQALVVQGRGDLGPPLAGQVVHDAREVGRVQLLEHRSRLAAP
jgi:hypothetical protein